MPRRARAWLCIGCWLTGAAWTAFGAGHNPPLTTAELLVDLARDRGLTQRGQQTEADVQHVRALLQAAARLAPDAPDPYVWLYELAVLDGDQVEAARMLTALLNADPAHEGAFALWLAAGTRAQQTVEQRVEWLQAVAAAPRPPALLAHVHVALARMALEQMNPEEARRQLDRALTLEPASLDAATLALETLSDDAGAADRLRAALRVLQLTPWSVQVAWQVGSILDEYGFADDAARFYEHARAVHQQASSLSPVPAGFLLGLARNLHARGQIDAAIARASEAAADPTAAAEAGMTLHYLLKCKGDSRAEVVRTQLVQRFAALREPAEFPVNEVAQAAWFYCTIEPQPDRALMLAKEAAQRAPADAFVQRVLGWAQALGLQTDDARATLTPIAGRDAYAAYMLAKLLCDAGDRAAGQRVIAGLEPMPNAGPAFDLLNTLDLSASADPAITGGARLGLPNAVELSTPATQPATAPAGEVMLLTQPTAESQPAASQPSATTRPATRRYPELVRALAGFDERVLEFHRDSARFLEAKVTMDDPSPGPGEPWWAVFMLTNRGPFPITLGPDAMVNPAFLLSFSVEGDRKREYPALMTVNLDHVRVLYPGQSARVRRTLDVGPLRRIARESPQQAQRITMNVLLDGVQREDGQWQPSPGGQALRPVYFNRVPAVTGREAIGGLFNAIAGESSSARVQAIEVMAELVGERQRADAKRLEYQPAAVPADRMEVGLLNLLGSESWELRVRTLDAMQVMGLDRRMVDAVEACLDHPHWLVRMMAVRLLARQGAAFAERAGAMSRNDPDDLVRALAESYVAKWHK